MNFIKRDDTKPVKAMIEIFIDNELQSLSEESDGKAFDLSHLVSPLPHNGTIYKVMDEVCKSLTESGWNCYYKHYYTMVSRCFLFISPNTFKDKPASIFKYFVPYGIEWDRKENIFLPEK